MMPIEYRHDFDGWRCWIKDMRDLGTGYGDTRAEALTNLRAKLARRRTA